MSFDSAVPAPEPSQASAQERFTDAEAQAALRRAMRLVVVLAAVAAVAALLWLGWRSALLLVVGAAVSVSGLWEWQRLTHALAARMDAEGSAGDAGAPGIGSAITGLVLRLCLVLPVLYVSLRYLNGSAIALAAGLAMGVAALTFEALRLLRKGVL